jgi:hypothetical protein
VPEDPKAAALHHLNGLRELRMARHGAAITGSGVDVADSVRHRTPYMTAIFGWEEADVADGFAAEWQRAEELTNRATERDYAVLSADEAAAFVELTTGAGASVA